MPRAFMLFCMQFTTQPGCLLGRPFTPNERIAQGHHPGSRVRSRVGEGLLCRCRRSTWAGARRAFILGGVSFVGLAFTMVLAWRNELSMPVPDVESIRGMVSLHGVLNTLVVAPCFLLAASLSSPVSRSRRGPPSGS